MAAGPRDCSGAIDDATRLQDGVERGPQLALSRSRVRLFWRDLSVSRFERELVVVVARVVDVAFFLCEVVLPVGVEVVVGFEGA